MSDFISMILGSKAGDKGFLDEILKSIMGSAGQQAPAEQAAPQGGLPSANFGATGSGTTTPPAPVFSVGSQFSPSRALQGRRAQMNSIMQMLRGG